MTRIDTPEMAAAIVSRAYAETRAAQEAVSTETFPAIGGPAYGTGSGVTVNLRGADVWVRRPASKPTPERSRFIDDYRTLARFRDTCRVVGFSAALKRGTA